MLLFDGERKFTIELALFSEAMNDAVFIVSLQTVKFNEDLEHVYIFLKSNPLFLVGWKMI